MLAGVAPVTAAMRDSDARTQDNPLQDNLYIAPFASWSPVCRFWLPGERVCADFYQYALVACSIFPRSQLHLVSDRSFPAKDQALALELKRRDTKSSQEA